MNVYLIFIGSRDHYMYFKGVLKSRGKTFLNFSPCGVARSHIDLLRVLIIVFCRVFKHRHFYMREARSNQRRRSTRLQNRPQPSTPTNEKPAIVFTPKLKYENSGFNVAGVFVVNKHKRALPTESEKEVKRQKQL